MNDSIDILSSIYEHLLTLLCIGSTLAVMVVIPWLLVLVAADPMNPPIPALVSVVIFTESITGLFVLVGWNFALCLQKKILY